LKVTAQTVLGSQLLRLAEADVEEAVARELMDNPALERVADNWYETAIPTSRVGQSQSRSVVSFDETEAGGLAERIAERESAFDQLVDQARLLVPHTEITRVVYLIYCLDDHGFLTTPAEELAQELHLSSESLQQAISWLQQLDPPGLGARNVRECLQLQCDAIGTRDFECHVVRRILDDAWEPFIQQQWRRVSKITGCSVSVVHDAVGFMRQHFYLFPLLLISAVGEDQALLTRPDLIVRRDAAGGAERFVVEVPGAETTRLRICPFYERTAHKSTDEDADLGINERAWVQQAVEQARLFISGLEQRYDTLRQLGEYLVSRQADFFAGGRGKLKPLTRAQVAHDLGIHPSTISRAVSDKILQLPDGRLIELRQLFDPSLAVKEAIRALLAASPTPLSDREITERLHGESFDLSRRTVAQYREELGIPRLSLRVRSQALGKAGAAQSRLQAIS
jgi:RNA polymerase sigma-54 factor